MNLRPPCCRNRSNKAEPPKQRASQEPHYEHRTCGNGPGFHLTPPCPYDISNIEVTDTLLSHEIGTVAAREPAVLVLYLDSRLAECSSDFFQTPVPVPPRLAREYISAFDATLIHYIQSMDTMRIQSLLIREKNTVTPHLGYRTPYDIRDTLLFQHIHPPTVLKDVY